MLKNFVMGIDPLYKGLAGARSSLLEVIRENCHPEKIGPTRLLIRDIINDDVKYQKTPLNLRNQRTYAVKVCESPP